MADDGKAQQEEDAWLDNHLADLAELSYLAGSATAKPAARPEAAQATEGPAAVWKRGDNVTRSGKPKRDDSFHN